MPVTQNSVITHHLVEATVRMDQETLGPSSMAIVFQRRIDGVVDRMIPCTMSAVDLAGYLLSVPVTGKDRGTDLTDAIYAWAIAQGHISGVVS